MFFKIPTYSQEREEEMIKKVTGRKTLLIVTAIATIIMFTALELILVRIIGEDQPRVIWFLIGIAFYFVNTGSFFIGKEILSEIEKTDKIIDKLERELERKEEKEQQDSV
jgi:hypothetical protein